MINSKQADKVSYFMHKVSGLICTDNLVIQSDLLQLVYVLETLKTETGAMM